MPDLRSAQLLKKEISAAWGAAPAATLRTPGAPSHRAGGGRAGERRPSLEHDSIITLRIGHGRSLCEATCTLVTRIAGVV